MTIAYLVDKREFEDLRDRILSYMRARLEAGGEVKVRRLIENLGITAPAFYQVFPGGLGEALEAAKAVTTRKLMEGCPYSEAFKLLEGGASPLRLVVRLGLEPKRAEELYNDYLRLRGIDLDSMRREADELKRLNARLEQRLNELTTELEALRGELDAKYEEGYRDGYEKHRSQDVEGVMDFVVWLFHRIYPGFNKVDILTYLKECHELYRLERLKKEFEERFLTKLQKLFFC